MYFVNKRSLVAAFAVLSVLLVIICGSQNAEASSVREESYVPTANVEAGNNNNNNKSPLLHRHDHKNDILKKNTEIIYGQDDDDDDDDDESGEGVANNAAEQQSVSSSSSASAAAAVVPPALVKSSQPHQPSEFGLGFKSQNDKKSKLYEKTQRYPEQEEETDVDEFLNELVQDMAYEDYAKMSSSYDDDDDHDSARQQQDPDLNNQIENLLNELYPSQEEEDEEDDDHDDDKEEIVKSSIKPVNLVEVSENLMQESDYNKKLTKKDQNVEALDESIMPAAEVINSQSIKGGNHPSMALKQASHHQQDEETTSRIDLLRKQNDYLFIFVVGGCVTAGLVALIAAGACWYTVHKSSRTIILTDYSMAKGGGVGASGATNLGGSKISLNSGDRRLAQSAQMYHYQHQKQQMIAMEKANNDTKPDNQSDSEGETEEGDYTVYECPGLAPTGEMEVKNPLFKEEFSSNNIQAAAQAATTAPPAYSSVLSANKEDQLIQIDQQQQSTSVTTVNETVKTTTEQSTTIQQ